MHIKDKRLAASMSQEELARAADVSRVSITRYETGERIPNLEIARKIANALGCKIDDLIKED